MKQQTIYFLQALWDVDVQREQIGSIAKEASLYEINHLLSGVLDEQTIWVSEKAKSLKRQVEEIQKDIKKLGHPYQLIGINNEYQKVIGELHALQLKTVKTLDSESGPMFENLHIIVKQLFPFALKKMQEQTYFQLYRMMILNGKLPNTNFYLPTSNFLEEWIHFYRNKLLPMFESLDDKTLDGRWAYERKNVTLNNRIKIEQFVAVKPEYEELKTGIGRPQIRTGEDGHLRIYGRGYITNLTPWDMLKNINIVCENELSSVKDISLISDENAEPNEILDAVFGREKYLIAPEKYFELINRCIIANIFYHRIRLGNCIYCGSPLYHDKCPKCE